MANPWMTHLAKIRKANPGKSLKECMKLGKKSYKKGGSIKVGGSVKVGGSLGVGSSLGVGGKLKKKNGKKFVNDFFYHGLNFLKHYV